MTTLTIADLDNGKRDLQTICAVSNSPQDFTTTRYGDNVLTLAGALRRLGYTAPVPYTSGLTVDSGLFTVSRDGVIYAPDPSLVPFTTSAWNAAQWRPVQNTANTNQVYQFPTLGAAQAAAATLPEGSAVVVEGASQGHVAGGAYVATGGAPAETAASYSDLLAYAGKNTLVQVSGLGVAGVFSLGAADPSVAPNGITVFRLSDGRIARRQYTGRVSALWAGAVGDGVADDAAAIAKLIDGQFVEGVDGHGLTYKLNSRIGKTVSVFDFAGFKFTTPTTYTTPVGLNVTCNNVSMDAIAVDGGRGTYKTGLEPWKVFTSFLGVQSIEPVHPAFINIIAMSASAVVTIGTIRMENLCTESGITVTTLGRVTFGNQYFKNCANKTSHVYHSADDGVTQGGSTHMETAYTEDCGILPSSFTVDGVAKSFSDNYAPQGSFNLCVSFGRFTFGSFTVRNYGATAVTADRNISCLGGNVDIYHNNNRGWSNNPSGAFWDEACGVCEVDNLNISIMERDSRDYTTAGFDSSALQIFKKNGQKFKVRNLVIANNEVNPMVRRSMRMSVAGEADISINGFSLSGLTSDAAYVCSALPDNAIASRLRMGDGEIKSGNFVLDSLRSISFNDVHAPNSILSVALPGNPGITGEVDSVTLDGGRIGSVITTTVMNEFSMSAANCTGELLFNARIRSIVVNGNPWINGPITANVANSASITGNGRIESYVKIGDVQLFNIGCNGEIRTSVGAPAVWVAPTVESNIKGGTIVGNNVTITTGTVGAGFISVPAGLASVVQIASNTNTTTNA